MTSVGMRFADFTSREDSGSRAARSNTTRIGATRGRLPCRTVSCGSSASAVPIPTATASLFARSGGVAEAGAADEARLAVALKKVRTSEPGVDAAKIRTFTDYRKMFDEMHKSIDAVMVSTPDHTHGPAAAMAMGRASGLSVCTSTRPG